MTTLLITSYLEPEYIDRIRGEFPEVSVVFRADLIGKPRYAADHTAKPERTPEQETEWRGLLAQADVLFDFDYSNLAALPELAPNVKWIQSTSAGIGQLVKRSGFDTRTNWTMTTASGIHARPLAEFALMGMLMFAKNYQYLFDSKASKYWARYSANELFGKTVMVVGLGSIGEETARLASAFGMRVIGTRRDVTKPVPHVETLFPPQALADYLPEADVVVLATPHTPETENMLGAREIGLMKNGAVLVNIARGAVVDEKALIAALQSGHLAGAALDVFATEPLPVDSPLWEMPNVIVSPHSASTTDTENAKLVDLFCANLRRFLDGAPLENVLNPVLMY